MRKGCIEAIYIQKRSPYKYLHTNRISAAGRFWTSAASSNPNIQQILSFCRTLDIKQDWSASMNSAPGDHSYSIPNSVSHLQRRKAPQRGLSCWVPNAGDDSWHVRDKEKQQFMKPGKVWKTSRILNTPGCIQFGTTKNVRWSNATPLLASRLILLQTPMCTKPVSATHSHLFTSANHQHRWCITPTLGEHGPHAFSSSTTQREFIASECKPGHMVHHLVLYNRALNPSKEMA